MRGCFDGRGIGVEIGAEEVQWRPGVGVVVVWRHFAARAWARRGGMEGERRSEWRVWSDIVGGFGVCIGVIVFLVVGCGCGCGGYYISM